MATDQQNYLNAGIPVFAFFFLFIAVAVIGYLCKTVLPRNSLSGTADTVSKVLIGLCGFQVVSGLFFVFSAAQGSAFILMLTPLLGIFGLFVLDPYFLVFFTAINVFFLQSATSLLTAFSNDGCAGTFGNDHYCANGWRTFLMLLATVYQFIMMIQIFGNFYFFTHFHFGAHQTSSSSNLTTPLLGNEHSTGDRGKQAPF